MRFIYKGKRVFIDDNELKQNIEKYNLTETEAIQMYLEDEGLLENDEISSLEENAKENKISHEATAKEKKVRKPRERKSDEEKEYLINCLKTFLNDLNNVSDINVTNIGKIIEFRCGNSEYKLDLVRKRAKKE